MPRPRLRPGHRPVRHAPPLDRPEPSAPKCSSCPCSSTSSPASQAEERGHWPPYGASRGRQGMCGGTGHAHPRAPSPWATSAEAAAPPWRSAQAWAAWRPPCAFCASDIAARKLAALRAALRAAAQAQRLPSSLRPCWSDGTGPPSREQPPLPRSPASWLAMRAMHVSRRSWESVEDVVDRVCEGLRRCACRKRQPASEVRSGTPAAKHRAGHNAGQPHSVPPAQTAGRSTSQPSQGEAEGL